MTTEVDRDALTRSLRTAVDQLTRPGLVELRRDIPHPGTIAWQLVADDRALETDLADRIRSAHESGDDESGQRALADLERLNQRKQARTATTAPIPPLLAQLLDEIPNSSNGESGTGKPGSRSPLAVGALDLAQDIARAVGAPVGARLLPAVRDWASSAPDWIDDHLAERTARAMSWPEQVRGVLDPVRRWTAAGCCPDCGNDAAWIIDDSGERVRRPALEFDRAEGVARCLRCPARWRTEAQLRQLAKYLTEANRARDEDRGGEDA